jgi:membrane protein YqaA with SNARE-associated domain
MCMEALYTRINNRTYDLALHFFSSPLFLFLLAIWAFFEASVWFLAPDLLLLLYFLTNPKQYKKILALVVTFSILGGISYYLFVTLNPVLAESILLQTPFVAQRNIVFVENLFVDYGVVATVLQSITLIPFKIWTFLAVQQSFSFFHYIFFAIITRCIRFSVLGGLFYWAGTKQNLVRNHYVLLLFGFFIAFFGIMVVLEL